ncbi:hypothetical protein ACQPZJ_44825 [Actinoplanes sp. CA-054009]
MRGAEIEALIETVMRACNDASVTGRRVAVMTAVVDATWSQGYAAGVVHGHRFVSDYFARIAKQTLAEHGDRLDPESRGMLRAVAGTAAAVAASAPTARDPGPSRHDYLTATGDADGTTDTENAAIAARVGWTHGYQAGDADAGWSAASHIGTTVSELLGASTVRRLDINGQRGDDWLIRADIGARTASELDIRHPGPLTVVALRPLRQAGATPATDSVRPAPGRAAPQRQGRGQ